MGCQTELSGKDIDGLVTLVEKSVRNVDDFCSVGCETDLTDMI